MSGALLKTQYWLLTAMLSTASFSPQDGNYPTELDGVEVTSVRDVTTGYDSAENDKQCRLPQQVSR